ncbi:MAG: DinB family protein [Chloroflexi bacterium]|nr:DinB family protein [Chloroflexota bacterium]
MPIEPDTKNWTWVLSRPCPECGFDPSTFPAREVADALRENVASWRLLLQAREVRTRPAESRWSALEYGCHVRDVFRIFDVRLSLMLSEDDPLFENWDQDQTAIEDAYADQDPLVVIEELETAGLQLAANFDAVADDAWQRPGRRSDGAGFTVDTLARYLVHDPIHHLWDVRGGYELLHA